jgi:hypothetical protein
LILAFRPGKKQFSDFEYDRSYFYFWRVEWLEKIEPEKGQGKGQGA